jgi:hypothetical protein
MGVEHFLTQNPNGDADHERDKERVGNTGHTGGGPVCLNKTVITSSSGADHASDEGFVHRAFGAKQPLALASLPF